MQEFIRRCLTYNQVERPDVLTIALDPYLTYTKKWRNMQLSKESKQRMYQEFCIVVKLCHTLLLWLLGSPLSINNLTQPPLFWTIFFYTSILSRFFSKILLLWVTLRKGESWCNLFKYAELFNLRSVNFFLLGISDNLELAKAFVLLHSRLFSCLYKLNALFKKNKHKSCNLNWISSIGNLIIFSEWLG